MDHLEALRTLVRVVETKSFSAPAREMGIGQPAVSKIIARLEAEVGVRLVGRTTRQVNPTPAGLRFVDEVRPLVQALDERFAAVTRGEHAVSGTVRVATAPGFGRAVMLSVVNELRADHPALAIELSASDRHVDLVAENIDLAIRGGPLASTNDIAKRVAESPLVTVASLVYLARHGEPRAPAELDDHDCIQFFTQGSRRTWRYGRPKATTYRPKRAVFLSSLAEDVRAALLAHLGVAQVPGWMVAHDLAAGTMKAVMRTHEPAPVPLYLVKSARDAPERLRVVERYLRRAFAREPHTQWGPRATR